MEFPIFQVPYLGNGLTIALNAVLHVMLSHGLAIGAVTIIVLAEYLGLKKASPDWENFARDFLKFSVIVITGVGAITGVGIWLITSALSPRGIGSMLRIFFWPWFIEWTVFTLEVVVILAYYFLWDRWIEARKKRHIRLGLGYTCLAFISAFLITGILGFMLTPDGWPWNKNFWTAFFNPTFLPQLFLRLAIAFALGAVFSAAFAVLTRRSSAIRGEVLRLTGKILLVSLAVAALSSWWYFRVVPSRFKTHAVFSVLTSKLSQHPEVFFLVNGAAILTMLVFAVFALRGSASVSRILIIPVLLLCLGLVSEFERMREFIRGPYLMPGYMYSNQVLLKESPFLDRTGTLENSYWFNLTTGHPSPTNQGAYLFAQNCSMCHTISGVNAIEDRVRGRTEDGIFVIIGHTHEMIPFMPPFSGTDAERKTLARFFYDLSQGKIKLEAPSRFAPLRRDEGE
jgi:mono/diheme cytochrome c family protein